MSKSKYNVVTPRYLCRIWSRYFAFVRNVLDPLEQAKPWNTAGFQIWFLEKLWRLYEEDIWWSLMRANQRQLKDLAQNQESHLENLFQYLSFSIHDLR
jgi:leucyl-tRNA synthetase